MLQLLRALRTRERHRSPRLWSGDVVPVHLSPAKEVVTQHASGKQENRDRQKDDEEELCKSKPTWILFFRNYLVPIRRHAFVPPSSQAPDVGSWLV